MSPDRFTPLTARRWRAPERATERCQRMRELSSVGLNQMEIALVVFREFGNPETGKPIDHSTVWHHLQKKCRCDLWILQGGASVTRSRDD